MDLRDKVFIVSGASRGIGRALCLELAQRGARLALNARDPEPLTQTLEDCRSLGAAGMALAGDVSRAEVAQGLAAQAVVLGGPDGFFHVAGVLHPGPQSWELAEHLAREVMDASFGGAASLARAVYPLLLARGGGLAVFFGSGAAEKVLPGIGLYCAAKAAEEALMRQLAAEVPEVTAMVYRPAVVETRMQRQGRQAEGGAARQVRGTFRGFRDAGELLTPEEAARGLLRVLEADPRVWHGRVADPRDMNANPAQS